MELIYLMLFVFSVYVTVGNRFVLSLANVTQLCVENLQKRSGGQEPDPQTGFSHGNQA